MPTEPSDKSPLIDIMMLVAAVEAVDAELRGNGALAPDDPIEAREQAPNVALSLIVAPNAS